MAFPLFFGPKGGGPWSPAQSIDGTLPSTWLRADTKVSTSGARQFYSADKAYLTIADNAALSTGDIDFTVAGWVYLDSTAATQVFLSKGSDNSAATTYEYYLHYNSGSSRFRFAVSSGSAATVVSATSFGAPTTAAWYYIVATHDAAADTISIQVNNGTVDSTAHTTGSWDSTFNFNIGTIDTDYMSGRMSKAAFWKRTLTTAERTWLYNSGEGRLYGEIGVAGTDGSALATSLSAYWNLNEGDATDSAIDAHSTNDLTVTGAELLSNTGFETVTQTYGARQFTAASSMYFAGTDNATLEMGDNDCWFSAWVYLDSKATDKVIMSKYYATGDQREYYLHYSQASDRFRFVVSSSGAVGTVTTVLANTLGSPSTGTWYFIMAYHDAVNNTINISGNGGAFDSAAHASGIFTGTALFQIGSAEVGAFMDGRLTRLGIGKSPGAGIDSLKTTIRDALYNSGKGLTYGALTTSNKTDWGLVEYWNGDETSSADLTGDHATITLTNTNTVGVAADMGPQADFGSWTENLSGGSTANDETSAMDAGSHALRMDIDPSNGNLTVSQAILTVGNTYSVSARVKHSSGGSSTTVLRAELGSTLVVFTSTTSWATQTATGVCTTSSNFRLARAASAAGLSLYFDTVSVVSAGLNPVAGPQESSAMDSVGTNHGVLTNMDTIGAWSSDVPSAIGTGYSLTFDGADDFVRIPDFAHSLTTLSAFCWIKSTSANKYIFTHHEITGNQKSWSIFIAASGVLTVFLYDSTSGNVIRKNYSGTTTINAGVWTHVGFTVNVATDLLTLYVNGLAETPTKTTDTTLDTSLWNSTGSLAIGCALTSDAWTSGMAGNVDDCRIYNEVVSAANVLAIKNGTNYTTNLVGHWKLDDGPQSQQIVDGDPVVCWESKGTDRTQFCQATASKRPLYVASAIGGRPGVDFDGTDDLLMKSTAFLTGTSGTVFVVYRLDAVPNTYQRLLSSSDEATADKYFFLDGRGNTANPHINIEQSNADTAEILDGDTTVNVDANYIATFSSSGTAYSARLNGVAQTLNADSGANNGDWWDDTTGKDNVVIGARKTNSESGFTSGQISEIIVYPADLSTASKAKVERYLATRYAITI